MSVPQTSTVPLVLDTLKALLEARKEESGSALAAADGRPAVTITTAPSGDPDILESIQFGGVPEDQAWKSLGGLRRQENYPIEGSILILRRGAGEDKAKESRDRAYALLSELEIVLRANPTLDLGARTDVQLASALLFQGWQENGRLAAIDFTILVKAELTK